MRFITTFLKLEKGQYLSKFKAYRNIWPRPRVDLLIWKFIKTN